MDKTLKDKVAIIGGGAKNLGGLISREFARCGTRGIVVHYNSSGTEADAKATVEAVEAAGSKAVLFQADLRLAR